jgi:nucleoside-diphosphate-sugar epimerase
MNVLLIGGTRFIGPHVVRQLLDGGHHVTFYHRGEHDGALPSSVRHVRHPQAGMPVRHFAPELLAPAPDAVVHMVAMGEADARAAVEFFRSRVPRMVWISSGDVYRAYGRFTGIEPGPIEPVPLAEDAPLRSVLYPYRALKPDDPIAADYEKILMERIAQGDDALPATILRLPKVYGEGENADLATVYSFRQHPQWRWTHGYVQNVAAAIVLAALSPQAVERIYNVGEPHTPTVAERLAMLPPSALPSADDATYDFHQDMVYDTSRIRTELGYRELLSEAGAMLRVAQPSQR